MANCPTAKKQRMINEIDTETWVGQSVDFIHLAGLSKYQAKFYQ